jgi:hypothetical protein
VVRETGEAALARARPGLYANLKKSEMIMGGILTVGVLTLFALSIYAGTKHSEAEKLRRENERLKRTSV